MKKLNQKGKRKRREKMIKNKQMIKTDLSANKYGDCYRTLISCMLNIKPESVPHFFNFSSDDPDFKNKSLKASEKIDDFLLTYGFRRLVFPCPYSLTFLYHHNRASLFSKNNPGVYCMMHGITEKDSNIHHVCIYLNGKLYWDPSGNDKELILPCEDGFYWVTILTSTMFGE